MVESPDATGGPAVGAVGVSLALLESRVGTPSNAQMHGLPAILLCITASAALARPQEALVLHGGRIWTGEAGRPLATAIALRDGKIVGFDAVALALRDQARAIDLGNQLVVPGFIDAHVHFLSGGDELLAPDLRSAQSADELGRRLAERAAQLPKGTWMTAGNWDHENWPGSKLPTRQDLDRHVPDHPVFVTRLDGHMAVANSHALALAGITRTTADPEGGAIVRSADGEPAGVLKDAAMALVSRHVPAWSKAQRLERARAALRHAAALGVTGVHDMLDGHEALATYQELRRRGELTLRVTIYAPISAHKLWGGLAVERGFGDAWLKLNGVKAFADGSLGSTTALFFDPYADAPTTSGLAQTNLEPGGLLDQQVGRSLADGLQPAIHAIGDRAIRAVLDILARHGDPTLRPRIEHAQHIAPADLARFAELGVIASMQPYHCVDDGRWAEKRIGKTRCDTTYAFRDLLDRKAVLAFGSDWPVAPLAPLAGIHAAVTRATLDGKHPEGWVPRQKITLEEALRAYTAGSAHAAGDEALLGTLAAGKLADLVVLDRDLFAVPAAEIRAARVVMTIVGGRIVHAAAR